MQRPDPSTRPDDAKHNRFAGHHPAEAGQRGPATPDPSGPAARPDEPARSGEPASATRPAVSVRSAPPGQPASSGQPERQDWKTPVAAALVLVVCLGFGRFAFTGLYPQMVADHRISVAGGSYAASANYAGYLVGALLAAAMTRPSSHRVAGLSMLAMVAGVGLLWLPLPEWLVIAIRGLSGIASATGLVAASNWLIHDRCRPEAAPTLFAGVGIGILASAEMIAGGHLADLASTAIWLLLAAASLVLSILAIRAMGRDERPTPPPEAMVREPLPAEPQRTRPSGLAADSNASPHSTPSALGATRLITVYGLAGFGYIITATYLPLLVHHALAALDPVHVWALFGLGAAPSCYLWYALRERWGTRLSLIVNLVVQAVGVVLPVLHLPSAYIASAILVGGTFMGTVTIAMPAARLLAAKVRFNMLAIMTASYGLGQILGPLVAGRLFAMTASFDASLWSAAAALVAGAILCLPKRRPNADAPAVQA